MPTPYNLDVQNDCNTCVWRANRDFCCMSDATIADLQEMKFTGVYPKGSTLFVEGEKPRGVFVLCSGKVKLTTSSSDGKTLIVKIVEPGELLGVSATILDQPYEVTAETTEPSQLNFVRREDFHRFLAGHADASMQTARQLSLKYHAAQRELRSLGLSHTTSEKLARLLLDWSRKGEQTERGTRMKVLLTHEEMAQMLGTTRETVTRLLGDFRRKKIIEVKGSTMMVLESDQLSAMVST